MDRGVDSWIHGFSLCVSLSARFGIQNRNDGEKVTDYYGSYLFVVDAHDALTGSKLFITVELNSSFDKPNWIG